MKAFCKKTICIGPVFIALIFASGCSGGGGNNGGGTPQSAPTSDYIAGYVEAPNGSGLAGITVAISLPDGTSRTAVTGSSGYYYFGGLTNANYLVTPLLSGYGFQPPSLSVAPTTADYDFASIQVRMSIYGLDFSPYETGQSPDIGSEISEAEMWTRMSVIAPYTQWVRSYSLDHGLENSGKIAHDLGLKVAVGAWLSTDTSSNAIQMSALISAAQEGQVDLAVVGSEVLLRGDLTADQLIAYITQFRSAVPSVPVTTADEHNQLLANPDVMAACDVVFVNYYPYWEGVDITNAVAAIDGWQKQMVRAAGSKQVIISETGWPSAGDAEGAAIPSTENASYYFQDLVSWADTNRVSLFYFEAFDEAWKAASEGPQGAYWGLFDQNGIVKSGVQPVFGGQLLPDDWSAHDLPGGPGTPSLNITQVPEYGTSGNLQGRVLHLAWIDYSVVVYIYVNGWWVKPTFADPLTPLEVDGSWSCDVTTGGEDQDATAYEVYVVPYNYIPPLLGGAPSLPSELAGVAVTETYIPRNP